METDYHAKLVLHRNLPSSAQSGEPRIVRLSRALVIAALSCANGVDKSGSFGTFSTLCLRHVCAHTRRPQPSDAAARQAGSSSGRPSRRAQEVFVSVSTARTRGPLSWTTSSRTYFTIRKRPDDSLSQEAALLQVERIRKKTNNKYFAPIVKAEARRG